VTLSVRRERLQGVIALRSCHLQTSDRDLRTIRQVSKLVACRMLPLGIQEILNMNTVSSKVIILAPFNTEDELKIESCGNSLLTWGGNWNFQDND
jgi:hypothetical protein